MSYNRYLSTARPAATGSAGNATRVAITNSGGTQNPVMNVVTATTAANANHFICWRSVPAARRVQTTKAATAISRASSVAIVETSTRVRLVSAGRIAVGFGRSENSVWSGRYGETIVAIDAAAPATTTKYTAGRH